MLCKITSPDTMHIHTYLHAWKLSIIITSFKIHAIYFSLSAFNKFIFLLFEREIGNTHFFILVIKKVARKNIPVWLSGK